MNMVLGTVQFGLKYGINNNTGKVNKGEAFKILNTAINNGLNFLDTSSGYGDSEKVIGEFIKENSNKFKIISKYTNPGKSIKEILDNSLECLSLSKIYGYLIHSFADFMDNPNLWDQLLNLKDKGKVEKIGFSLYHPSELLHLIDNNIEPDIIQIPYNIFDQRFDEYFSSLDKNKIEVHVRSIFLQGLFFSNISTLSSHFIKVKNKIEVLHQISLKKNLSISSLCYNFVALNDNINKILIGVDSNSNLEENIKITNEFAKVKEVYGELKELRETDTDIILPYNWR